MQFEPFGLFSCKLKLSKMLGNEILFPDFTSCFWFPRNVFFFFFFFFFWEGGGGGGFFVLLTTYLPPKTTGIDFSALRTFK